jgi:hypothetical protein
MSRVHEVIAATALLLGCGSPAGSLDGSVKGHEVAVKEALFAQLPDGELFIAAANQENLCAIFNGDQAPVKEMDLLEISLANLNAASGVDPIVTGPYEYLSTYLTGPVIQGHWAYALLFWTAGCDNYVPLSPSSGTVTLESLGALQAGAQTVVSVDLNFGGEHLGGELKATFCALAATRGSACP